MNLPRKRAAKGSGSGEGKHEYEGDRLARSEHDKNVSKGANHPAQPNGQARAPPDAEPHREEPNQVSAIQRGAERVVQSAAEREAKIAEAQAAL
jgi:hypothetical protein